LRDICPQVARFGNQPVRGAISRVDEAFAAFYRRTREGQTPGYPRFKSRRRFRTVLYDEPVNWALRGLGTSPAKGRNGSRPALYVQGVGEITLSKKAVRQLVGLIDRGGEARTLSITRTATGAWRASVWMKGQRQADWAKEIASSTLTTRWLLASSRSSSMDRANDRLVV
jgi:putative transposase